MERVKGVEPSLSARELAADLGRRFADLALHLVRVLNGCPSGTEVARERPWLRAREGHAGGTSLHCVCLGCEADVELDAESVGQSFQDGEGRYGAAGFEPGDGGLRHARGVGELGLAHAVSFAEFSDGAAEFVGEARCFVLVGGAGLGHAAVAQL